MNTAVATTERNVYEQYSDAVNQNKIVGDLLKFNKGNYFSGQDEDEVKEGTQLVANMAEAMVGWVKWEGGKPTDQQIGRIAEGFVPVKRRELGDDDASEWERDDHGQPRDPWQMTNYLILKDPSGDRLYTFATSSKGGLNAVGRLCGTYGKHMRQRPDEFPIVALGVDSYKHKDKTYGRIYVPDFEIVGWAPKRDFEGALSAAESTSRSAESPAQTEF